MKVKDKILKIVLPFALIITILLPNTITVFAEGGDINITDSIVFINPFYEDYYDWEYEPNFRTMQILDVITFMNEHATLQSNTDYRPTTLENQVDNLYEYQLADIREKWFFEEEVINREPVNTVDGQGAYSSKLKYLIDNNIISRDTFYMFSPIGCLVMKDADPYTRLDSTSKKYANKDFEESTDFQFDERSLSRKVDVSEKSAESQPEGTTEVTPENE